MVWAGDSQDRDILNFRKVLLRGRRATLELQGSGHVLLPGILDPHLCRGREDVLGQHVQLQLGTQQVLLLVDLDRSGFASQHARVLTQTSWGRGRLVLSTCVAVLLTASCTHGDDSVVLGQEAPRPSPIVGAPLALTSEPPEAPPDVALGEVPIAPLSYEWFDESAGLMTTRRPDDNSMSSIPVVSFQPVANAAISSRVGFLRFDVSQFFEVDASGIPVGAPITTECLTQGSSCEILDTGSSLEVTFPMEPGVVFATISLTYALLSDREIAIQQGFADDYASYGFYVEGS